jgi:pyruvate,orthophosphate dikinase
MIELELVRGLAGKALENVELHKRRINALNVYPVPDGDTGTNLTLTVRAIVEALERSDATGAEAVAKESGTRIDYQVGTMIELPRACLTADRIAPHASFFSFGTNDLTQTTFGLSRDDSGRFLPSYVDRKILSEDPFQVLDTEGVGELVRIGAERGRSVKPDLKVGICGEHGGDPRSISFCNEIGLNYVSCSPFRVPVARLAAAQAALEADAKAAAEAAAVAAADEEAKTREAVGALG